MKKEIYFYTKYNGIYSSILPCGIIENGKIVERANGIFPIYEDTVLKLYTTDEVLPCTEKHFTYVVCSNLEKLQENLIEKYKEKILYKFENIIKFLDEKSVLGKSLGKSSSLFESIIISS